VSRDFRITVALLLGLFIGFCLGSVPVGFGWVDLDSMEPTLCEGQWILYCRWMQPRVGDVVSVWRPNDSASGFERVVHRVQGIDDVSGRVELRGDNVATSEYCPRADIRGVVFWPRGLRQ